MMGEKHKSVQTVCCGVKYLSTHRVAAVSQHMTPALPSRLCPGLAISATLSAANCSKPSYHATKTSLIAVAA